MDPTPSQEVERISCGRAHYDGSNPSCAEVSKGWWQLARCYRDSPITWWHVAAPSFRDTAWCCIFLARWNGRRIEVILSVVSLASFWQWLIRCAVDEKNDGCVKGAVLISAFFTYLFSSTICLVNTWKLRVAFQSALANKRIIKITLVTYFCLVFTCFNCLGESSNWWHDIHQNVAHAVMESPVSPGVHYQPWHSILKTSQTSPVLYTQLQATKASKGWS